MLGSAPVGSSSEALGHLRAFLRPLNAAARLSLGEAGEALIGLPQLNVPATLPVSLWSTNAIENVMRNCRGETAKVARWRLETNPLSRRTATARLHVERGFHRLKGFADLPKLVAALAQPSQTSTPVVVATLRATQP